MFTSFLSPILKGAQKWINSKDDWENSSIPCSGRPTNLKSVSWYNIKIKSLLTDWRHPCGWCHPLPQAWGTGPLTAVLWPLSPDPTGLTDVFFSSTPFLLPSDSQIFKIQNLPSEYPLPTPVRNAELLAPPRHHPSFSHVLFLRPQRTKSSPAVRGEHRKWGHRSRSAAVRNQAFIQGRQSQRADRQAVTLRPLRAWATCLRYNPKDSWVGVGRCEQSWVCYLLPTWRALLKPRTHFTHSWSRRQLSDVWFQRNRKTLPARNPTTLSFGLITFLYKVYY